MSWHPQQSRWTMSVLLLLFSACLHLTAAQLVDVSLQVPQITGDAATTGQSDTNSNTSATGVVNPAAGAPTLTPGEALLATRDAITNWPANVPGWPDPTGGPAADPNPCQPEVWGFVACLNGDAVGFFPTTQRLTGTLSAALGDASTLRFIDVSKNLLSGTLPPLAHLSNLQVLDVSNNMFTGAIPSAWGSQLVGVKRLSLSGNQLSGPIPAELANIATLTELFVDNNPDLCGDIPPGLETAINSTAGTGLGQPCAGSPPPGGAMPDDFVTAVCPAMPINGTPLQLTAAPADTASSAINLTVTGVAAPDATCGKLQNTIAFHIVDGCQDYVTGAIVTATDKAGAVKQHDMNFSTTTFGGSGLILTLQDDTLVKTDVTVNSISIAIDPTAPSNCADSTTFFDPSMEYAMSTKTCCLVGLYNQLTINCKLVFEPDYSS